MSYCYISNWINKYSGDNYNTFMRRLDSLNYSFREQVMNHPNFPYQKNEFYYWLSKIMKKRKRYIKDFIDIFDVLVSEPCYEQEEYLKDLFKNNPNLDLSKPVYTIKAIINSVYDISDFSVKPNNCYTDELTEWCLQTWEAIWWDTDTGKYSKEEILDNKTSEYHKKANLLSTIFNTYKKEYPDDEVYFYENYIFKS
ncbi:hypothetical protein BFS07_03650 [Clostridium perfringens]|uniref:hypothetical protein n=1 Tax=Clostridium perfringens TaxID=1502 RepID=UPI000D521452|nr:hypothetical protein [Clostridium perfringens]MCX0401983.1 hypothetical protein [Clostridium perfringens]PVE15630.1 hypothetical protein DDA98_10230 [Clostridium perfringens]TBX09817.1 hypothetical protein BFS07_03650 [Clostridium perfringens]